MIEFGVCAVLAFGSAVALGKLGFFRLASILPPAPALNWVTPLPIDARVDAPAPVLDMAGPLPTVTAPRESSADLIVLLGVALLSFAGWVLLTAMLTTLAKTAFPGQLAVVIGAIMVASLLSAGMVVGFRRLLMGPFLTSTTSASPPQPDDPGQDLVRAVKTGLTGVTLVLPWVYGVTMIATWVIERAGVKVPTEHELITTLKADPSAVMFTLIALSAVVATPLFEELLFRGVLQKLLLDFFRIASPRSNPAISRWLAVGVASVLFALLHPAFSWPGILVLSIGLGYVYERTGRLTASIVMHAAFNAISVLLAFFTTKGV